MYRGAVASAIRGKRGQALLRDLAQALDDLPIKELTSNVLIADDGTACALGCLGKKRGIDIEKLDPEDADAIAVVFGVNDKLIREIEFINDDWGYESISPEKRFARVRNWVAENLNPEARP